MDNYMYHICIEFEKHAGGRKISVPLVSDHPICNEESYSNMINQLPYLKGFGCGDYTIISFSLVYSPV